MQTWLIVLRFLMLRLTRGYIISVADTVYGSNPENVAQVPSASKTYMPSIRCVQSMRISFIQSLSTLKIEHQDIHRSADTTFTTWHEKLQETAPSHQVSESIHGCILENRTLLVR